MIDREQKQAMAQCAAHWWRLKLESNHTPSLIKDAGWDRGSSETQRLGTGHDLVMENYKRRQSSLRAEQLDQFEVTLSERLANMPFPSNLRVDYEPDDLLESAAKKAGIDLYGRLPHKTSMRIEDDRVQVGEGYRTGFVDLVITKRALVREQVFDRLYKEMSPKDGDRDRKPFYAALDKARALLETTPNFFPGDLDTLVDLYVRSAKHEATRASEAATP